MADDAPYGSRLIDALGVAARLHARQRRKGSDIPYLAHLLGTCAIALEHGATEDQAIAALLHDAIEDVEPVETARAAVAEFGAEVLRIVEACTDTDQHPKPPWRARKEAYVAHLRDADASVLLVSGADKLYNARSVVSDLVVHGEEVWERFTGGKQGTLWYYRALVDVLRENPRSRLELVDELERVVIEMERLAAG
jgi:GTP pyrophosphokinase